MNGTLAQQHVVRAFAVGLLVTIWAGALGAQTTDATSDGPTVFSACYAPLTGVVYRIKEPGLLQRCFHASHVEFSWRDGPATIGALTQDLSAGGFKITGLSAATEAGDAVPFQQAIKVSDQAGGDVAGSFGSLSVTQLRGRPIGVGVPNAGDVLAWSGTAWQPAAPAAGSGGSSIAGYVVVQSPNTPVPGGQLTTVNVICPAGKKGIGGGFVNITFPSTLQLFHSQPIVPVTGFPEAGWSITMHNNGTLERPFRAQAICVDG